MKDLSDTLIQLTVNIQARGNLTEVHCNSDKNMIQLKERLRAFMKDEPITIPTAVIARFEIQKIEPSF